MRVLRLTRAKVHPPTLQAVEALGSFLAWVPAAEQSYRELEKWLRRELVPGHEAVVKRGELLFGRKVLVYRPYWLASVVADRGPEWVLIDGPFRTIAGYPEREEALQLIRKAVAGPLPSPRGRSLSAPALGPGGSPCRRPRRASWSASC